MPMIEEVHIFLYASNTGTNIYHLERKGKDYHSLRVFMDLLVIQQVGVEVVPTRDVSLVNYFSLPWSPNEIRDLWPHTTLDRE